MTKKNDQRPAWTDRPIHFDPNKDYRLTVGKGVIPPQKTLAEQELDSSWWSRLTRRVWTAWVKLGS